MCPWARAGWNGRSNRIDWRHKKFGEWRMSVLFIGLGLYAGIWLIILVGSPFFGPK
jgi:hypothetical protein